MSHKEATEPQPLVLAQTPWIRLGGYSRTAPTSTTKIAMTVLLFREGCPKRSSTAWFAKLGPEGPKGFCSGLNSSAFEAFQAPETSSEYHQVLSLRPATCWWGNTLRGADPCGEHALRWLPWMNQNHKWCFATNVWDHGQQYSIINQHITPHIQQCSNMTYHYIILHVLGFGF
jgi:hypothetical protein